jgi:hypothetical protein
MHRIGVYFLSVILREYCGKEPYCVLFIAFSGRRQPETAFIQIDNPE